MSDEREVEPDWRSAAEEVIARFTSGTLVPSQRQALIALGDALRTARSPQGEDHEAGIAVLRWNKLSGWNCDRVPADWPRERTEVARLSPSRDGTVAVEDVARWLYDRARAETRHGFAEGGAALAEAAGALSSEFGGRAGTDV
jgi:hypothetical protein